MTSKSTTPKKSQKKAPTPAKKTGTDMKVKMVGDSSGLAMPRYESADAAGMDLLAAIPGEMILAPGEWKMVPSGISIELEKGFEAQVRPRSGLAFKKGVTVLNSPGTVDRDFRGEIGIVLINHGTEAFTVRRGMRVAQLVVAPVVQADVVGVDDLSETSRGSGGFGSTGTGASED